MEFKKSGCLAIFGGLIYKKIEITIQVRLFWNNITWRAVCCDQTKSKILLL